MPAASPDKERNLAAASIVRSYPQTVENQAELAVFLPEAETFRRNGAVNFKNQINRIFAAQIFSGNLDPGLRHLAPVLKIPFVDFPVVKIHFRKNVFILLVDIGINFKIKPNGRINLRQPERHPHRVARAPYAAVVKPDKPQHLKITVLAVKAVCTEIICRLRYRFVEKSPLFVD